MNNENARTRESDAVPNWFLNLFDDTRHLVSPVEADMHPVKEERGTTLPMLINIETAPESINNDAQIDAMLADLDAFFAEFDSDEPMEQRETPAGVVKPDGIAAERPVEEEMLAPLVAAEVQRSVITEQRAPVVEVKTAPAKSVSTDKLMPDIAPGFRGYAPLPMIATTADRDELKRRRFEDIVYAHRCKHRPYLDSSLGGGRYRDIMRAEALDLDLVREFVDFVSSAEERMTDEHIAVNLLFIPAPLQLQLCQLASEAIKRKRRKLMNEEQAVREKLLRSLCETGDGKLEKHVPMWVRLRTADELIKFVRTGRVKRGCERSPQEVGQLLRAMTGEAMDRGNVRAKLKTLDNRLGGRPSCANQAPW